MKISNASIAVVRESKVTDYLLSSEHELGRFKEAFFRAFGFSRDQWETLQEALLSHVRLYDTTAEELTPYGVKYIVEGPISSPDGRDPLVRSIWIIRAGQRIPEFVTAYPLPSEKMT